MTDHASVIRVTHFQPVPDKREELIAILQHGVERMREIEGCFGVQICTPREDPEHLVVVSRWASQAGLDRFLLMMQPGGALDLSDAGGKLMALAPRSEHLTPIEEARAS